MRTNCFLQDLQKSNRTAPARIHQALKQRFGDRYRFYDPVADHILQKAGVDLVANFSDGQALAIELKTLSFEPRDAQGELTLPLETFSSVERKTPGFLLQADKQTRYVVWLLPNGQAVILPFRTLAATFRRNFRDWKNRFKVSQQKTSGRYEVYTSECVWVPVAVIEQAMQKYLDRYHVSFASNLG